MNIKHLKNRLVASLEIVIGVILLIREIRDFILLPTMTEVDKMFYDLVDFTKYRENTYHLLYLWILFLVTGISYWISKKLYWIFTQILLITLFCAIVFTLIEALIISYFSLSIVLLVVLIPFIFIWIKTYKRSYLSEMGVNNKTKYGLIILEFFLSVIYLILL
jgi:hypothetical protein